MLLASWPGRAAAAAAVVSAAGHQLGILHTTAPAALLTASQPASLLPVLYEKDQNMQAVFDIACLPAHRMPASCTASTDRL